MSECIYGYFWHFIHTRLSFYEFQMLGILIDLYFYYQLTFYQNYLRSYKNL